MIDKNKILGMLVGCAYGDAMGMPSEMMSEQTFHKAFPSGIDTFMSSSSYDFIGRHFKAGEVTDDTINTLLLCDSIIENHGVFSTTKYLDLLENWMIHHADKNPYIIGPSTKKALEAISKGTPMKEAGKFGTTNGSCMKVSPLGIICDYRSLDELVDTVEALCLPTHNTNIAISGASIIAAIDSYALRGGKCLDDIWAITYDVLDIAKKRGNQVPSASLKARLDIVRENQMNISKLQNLFGAGMETIETVPMVLAIITKAEFHPEKAALLAANLFGDTDTIGSISTAICGAINNEFSKQDMQFLERVNNINFMDYAEKLSVLTK